MDTSTTQHVIKVSETSNQRSELTVLYLACPFLCCDNCIRKMDGAPRFETIYDIIGFLDATIEREPISHPSDDDGDSDLGSTDAPKNWGTLHTGKHLAMRRQVLEGWRYNCWKKDYRLCSWSSVGVMSDPVLSKLALSTKIETVDDLLEAVSDWGYANKYGHEVLSLLKDADQKHQLASRSQRVKTRQINKKRKQKDWERDEELQGSVTASLTLTHTRMISPVLVKHVELPTRSQPLPPRPRPVLISCPYTRTDIFDSLMDSSRCM